MSGRDVKPRLPRMPGRARPSLIAAAQAQPEDAEASEAPAAAAAPAAAGAIDLGSRTRIYADGTQEAPSAPAEAMDVDVPDVKPTLQRTATAGSATMVSSRSTTGSGTPAPAEPVASGSAPAAAPKMKFKPKMPVRRAAQEDVKPDIAALSASSSTRGRPATRARGRGAGPSRGGRTQAAANTVAAGPFGGSRANSSRRMVAPPAPPRYQPDNSNIEVYSDNEDGTRAGVIDIEAVSALSESAPTSVYRERDLDGGKAKAKEMEKAKLKELKKKKKAQRRAREAVLSNTGAGSAFVKAEPVSPNRPGAILPDPNAGVPAPLERIGDEMIPADEQQDRDADGRRVRATTTGTDMTRESEEVNVAHAINLSESESEDEEEDMEGDFVFVEGNDNPEDKLFTFQFPSNMPKFVAPPPPPDADGDVAMDAELKPEVKPSPALKKRRNPAAPPPEGRIGTMVVMKSGKVKMVMGEGANAIVMNVTPGVPNTFLQQLVHLDKPAKSTTVLGEVHKQYTVTPDLDRLLEELFLNDGETPGDRERKAAAEERRMRAERGLVKMEMSSP